MHECRIHMELACIVASVPRWELLLLPPLLLLLVLLDSS